MLGRIRRGTAPLAAFAVGFLAWASATSAQWVTFTNDTATRFANAAGNSYSFSTDIQEKDMAFGDIDQDGDKDLVIVRKTPLTNSGKHANYLLMNEAGVLTNRTAQLAPQMLDLTADRDVEMFDANGDGWLDVLTTVTFPATPYPTSDAQSIRSPRLYINLGDDAGGNWLGLLYTYSDQRIPDITGNVYWFACSGAYGDVDHDNDNDIWFTDYAADTSVTGGPGGDLKNTLWLNNGSGFYTNMTQTNVVNSGASAMVGTGFGTHGAIVNLNGDTHLDLFSTDSCSAIPRTSRYAKNNGSGVFTATVNYTLSPLAVYHYDAGDLNNDGKMDFYLVDDANDKYFLNTGNNAQGHPVFSQFSLTNVQANTTGGFGGNCYIADLDNDGWQDAIASDQDVDLSNSTARMAIYHNLGNAPNVTLSGAGDPFTYTAGPMQTKGTFDVAIFDINTDGKLDLVVGTNTGNKIFVQPVVDTTPPQISSSSPISGAIDIKQDRGAGGVLQGVNQVTINFNEGVRDAATNGNIAPASFSVTLTTNLGGLTPPVISSVTNNGGNSYTLNLSTPVKPGAWNTFTALVEDLAGNAIGANGIDLGYIPGDVSGNSSVSAVNVQTETTGINTCVSAGTCSSPAVVAQYDVNRSGIATPADALRLVQLLNGVNTQNAWAGVALPAQP